MDDEAVVSLVKSTLFQTETSLRASRLFVIRKEGLTTNDMLKAAQYLEYDRAHMFNHTVAFLDVTGGFDQQGDVVMKTMLGVTPTEYVLQSKDEISVLASQLAVSSNAALEVSIITVKSSLPNQLLNEISKEIQESVKKAGVCGSYVMAITGKRVSALASEEFISLQQTDSISVQTLSQAAPVRVTNVRDYLFPNTMSGILIMLFITIVLIIAFLNLAAVQTPYYFTTENISFGKIEK